MIRVKRCIKKNNEYIDIEVKHSIDDEEVEIYSDYANGFYWTGRANKEKMIITSCCLIDDIDAIIHQGQPDWASQFLADINNFCYDENKYERMINMRKESRIEKAKRRMEIICKVVCSDYVQNSSENHCYVLSQYDTRNMEEILILVSDDNYDKFYRDNMEEVYKGTWLECAEYMIKQKGDVLCYGESCTFLGIRYSYDPLDPEDIAQLFKIPSIKDKEILSCSPIYSSRDEEDIDATHCLFIWLTKDEILRYNVYKQGIHKRVKAYLYMV